MNRVRIWSAPRPFGEMAAEELRQNGVPAFAKISGTGTEMLPTAIEEVWIEDETLLEDEEVRQKIEQAIANQPLEPGDEEAIAQMPRQTMPEKPILRQMKLPLWMQVAIALLVAAVVLWMAISLGSGPS
jgi:hypothetical protein